MEVPSWRAGIRSVRAGAVCTGGGRSVEWSGLKEGCAGTAALVVADVCACAAGSSGVVDASVVRRSVMKVSMEVCIGCTWLASDNREMASDVENSEWSNGRLLVPVGAPGRVRGFFMFATVAVVVAVGFVRGVLVGFLRRGISVVPLAMLMRDATSVGKSGLKLSSS